MLTYSPETPVLHLQCSICGLRLTLRAMDVLPECFAPDAELLYAGTPRLYPFARIKAEDVAGWTLDVGGVEGLHHCGRHETPSALIHIDLDAALLRAGAEMERLTQREAEHKGDDIARGHAERLAAHWKKRGIDRPV